MSRKLGALGKLGAPGHEPGESGPVRRDFIRRRAAERNAAAEGADVSEPTLTGVVHELKCWPEFYRHVESGAKPFEVRRDDRDYHPGDVLHLREWLPSAVDSDGGYTGRSCRRVVTYLLDLAAPMFNAPGLVVMGLGVLT